MLKIEFGCECEDDENLVLVDMDNQEIKDWENFTIFGYVKDHKKYVGSTRIYLGIIPKELPETADSTKIDKRDEMEKNPLDEEISLKKDEPKKDEVKKDELKKDEPKKDEVKKDELKKDEPKKDEVKKDELKKDEPKKDEVKKDEPKKDELKKDELKKDELKEDELKKDGLQESANMDLPTQGATGGAPLNLKSSEVHTVQSDKRDSDFENALQYVKKEQEEACMRGACDLDIGELGKVDTEVYCPVYAVNPKVVLFQDYKGTKYEKLSTGYGDFVCIPHTDMCGFHEFCRSVKGDTLFIVNPALQYYLHYVHVSEDATVNITSLSDEVWELPDDLAENYRQWKSAVSA